MTAIPEVTDSTVKRIFASWEDRHKPRFSRRLGASQIGKPCDRALWYSFRWAKLEKFEGRMLRLFEKGHLEEACLCNELKRIGIDVQEVDPETNKQWEFSDLGDHFVCKLDAAACGFVEAPASWHVVEFKTANDKSFRVISKDGCKKAKPEHWDQCMTGMGMSGMERAAYIAVNKDTDEIYMERIRFDKKEWNRILQRAKEIIFAKDAPEKIGTGPSWYQCTYCTFKNICHDMGDIAEKNCRTCPHSMALEDGGWACDKHNKILLHEEQLDGCEEHQYAYGMIGESIEHARKLFDGRVSKSV